MPGRAWEALEVGGEGYIYEFFKLPLCGSEWWRLQLQPVYPKHIRRYPLKRRASGPLSRSGYLEKREVCWPCRNMYKSLRCDITAVLVQSQNCTANAWSQNTTILLLLLLLLILLLLLLCTYIYTGCPRRNVPDFGRVLLMLKYIEITQNTYVQSWTVTEITAREKCGLLAGPRTVPVSWQILSMFILECGVRLRKVSSY